MLKNKNAVIVGGSKGIGKAIAELLAKKGANICLISRSEDNLKQVTEEIKSKGGSADYIIGDISKPESMKNVFKQYKSSKRKIDILVNNSGIYRENSDTNPDNNPDLDIVYSIINTNMLGYWWTTLFVKDLLNDGASIINISSVNGITGKGSSDIYDMTKAAINNLTLNQARQLAKRRIRVNAICPSSTITPMREDAMGRYLKGKSRKEFDEYEASTIPFKRLCKPEEIASLALFLASNDSSYITGQIISIDGGFLLKPIFLDN